MSRREESEVGANMVMIDIRYIWSEIDSPPRMLKRRQPSRGVVFKRSRRWKKGIGVVGVLVGKEWDGNFDTTDYKEVSALIKATSTDYRWNYYLLQQTMSMVASPLVLPSVSHEELLCLPR